ncbi:hypothetical protein OEA41_001986 [Lepraria neglecta]|uniref:Uncharacterized protein n=1 Tax=Lepraria neglecta TaxID=209136 RepID=A0AAD9ZB65_9LECA|nr:hypothetical protein OEA41_001986 [Lepraria neglecta]
MHPQSEIKEVLDRNWPPQQAQTQIDVLDMEYHIGNQRRSVEWEQQLDDTSILKYLSYNASDNPTLRVLYAHCPFPAGTLFSDALQLHDVEIRVTSKSNEGYYQYLTGWDAGPSNAWFSYNVNTGSSTYLLFDCPIYSKDRILRRAHEDVFAMLSCPFAIDMLIAEECCSSWESLVNRFREELLHWENNGGEGIPLHSIIHTPHGTQRLHSLSRSLQTIIADLYDLDERLDFLIQTSKTYGSLARSKLTLTDSAAETIIFFKSRNCIWKRWVENYNERTRLMMNLFFSIASQVDNRTNLQIAELTSKISMEAKRDSSSMITIAAVTMVFLPGTFISAIFSMVFFNTATDINGKANLIVSPQWWYFPTITIPLTIIVFILWQWWRRQREAGTDHAGLKKSKNQDTSPKE